jgi:dihydrofolate synthase/folylpolyglutamate synthase
VSLPDSTKSDEILARLLALHPKVIDLSLGRLERLLAALGNPERSIPPVIHIAGTNGKGSTGAFIRAGLQAAGKKVHAYTSPHLARFHERIRLAGELIDEDALAALLEECEAANDGAPITFFEITTAAAFLAFSRTDADYTILEVGLGGRLDATNVIERPALTVITPISLDHQSYLGETLAEIAGEKAGILKARVPAVVGPQREIAMGVIADRARRLSVPIHAADADWTARREPRGFSLQYDSGLVDLPQPALPGDFQIDNAATAAMGLILLGIEEPSVLASAVRSAEWPARMQRLKQGPLVESAPAGSEVWLDGGHNPAAGEALTRLLADMEERDPKPLHMICGMLNTKDVTGYLRPFEGLVRRIYCLSIPGEDATLTSDELADFAEGADLNAIEVEDAAEAMRLIAGEEDAAISPPRILICGSLYLAGRVLRENG